MLPELGPALTREDPRYWDSKPRDHNGAGLFVFGPQEKRPAWPHRVKTGAANRAPATESRKAALGRMKAEQRRRLYRMSLGVAGALTGRSRARRGFVKRWKA
jgi:hypothetical protein